MENLEKNKNQESKSTQPTIPNWEIEIGKITSNSIALRWEKAVDSKTPQEELVYLVEWCESPFRESKKITSPSVKGKHTFTCTDLKEDTSYDILVTVINEDYADSSYQLKTVTTMSTDSIADVIDEKKVTEWQNTPPVLTDKTISIDQVTKNSITLTWEKAIDRESPQRKLKYYVSWIGGGEKSKGLFLTDVSKFTITGLKSNTRYAISLSVVDESSIETIYGTKSVDTLSEKDLSKPSATVTKPTTPTVRPTAPATSGKTTTTSAQDKEKKDKERREQIINGLMSGNYDPKKLLLSGYFSETENDKPAPYIKTTTGIYQAVTEQKKIDNEEIYIVGQGYNNKIYPGAILIADSGIAEGSPKPLMNVKRAPVDLYANSFGIQSTRKNITPTSDNIHEAINSLVNDYFNNPKFEAGQDAVVKTSYHSSKKSLALEFETDLSFGGNKVSLDLTSTEKVQSIIESFDFKQKFYTVSLGTAWQQSFDKLFADDETWTNIKAKSGNKPLCIVTSVTYGRDLHFLKEYKSEDWDIKSKEDIKVWGQTIKSKQDIVKNSIAQKSQFIAVGASSEIVASGLKADSDSDTIKKALEKNLKFSGTNQGNVIGYQLLLISGSQSGSAISPVYSGFIWTSEYKRLPNTVQVNVKCEVSTFGGQENTKVRLKAKKVKIDSEGKEIASVRTQVFEQQYGKASNIVTNQINLGINEYIEGYADLEILTRPATVAHNNWTVRHTSKIDVSSGAIELWLLGSSFAGYGNIYFHDNSPTKPAVQ